MAGQAHPLSVSTADQRSQSSGTHFHVRSFRRFSIQCAVYYASETVRGSGTVWNMSMDGWRVDGTEPVVPGTVMTLSVILPGKSSTVFVEQATVRWSRGREFGIQVSSIREDEQARLADFVRALV
ncbi:MAG: PilZ domain-containing protein [Nitrospiraceae bacterium]|nr:PilZ domain-containing protein [Nitrospiraceae bacterium]